MEEFILEVDVYYSSESHTTYFDMGLFTIGVDSDKFSIDAESEEVQLHTFSRGFTPADNAREYDFREYLEAEFQRTATLPAYYCPGSNVISGVGAWYVKSQKDPDWLQSPYVVLDTVTNNILYVYPSRKTDSEASGFCSHNRPDIDAENVCRVHDVANGEVMICDHEYVKSEYENGRLVRALKCC